MRVCEGRFKAMRTMAKMPLHWWAWASIAEMVALRATDHMTHFGGSWRSWEGGQFIRRHLGLHSAGSWEVNLATLSVLNRRPTTYNSGHEVRLGTRRIHFLH